MKIETNKTKTKQIYLYDCERCEERFSLDVPIEEYQFRVHDSCPNHELVSVSVQNDEEIGTSFFHTAKVTLTDGDTIDERYIAGAVAIEVGYHPAGYGCWNESVSVNVEEEGTFIVKWKSFSSCD